MATSISSFSMTVPAGTPAGSPYSVALNVNHVDPVESIHWRVPPGPRGHLGWWLAQSGVQVLPNMFGGPLIADGESGTWQLDNFPQSTAWSLVGWNTGTDAHTVYVEFAHQQTDPGGTGLTGDITAGFPTSEVDVAVMWTDGGGGVTVV